MAEIEAYAAARGWMPTTVVQRSTALGGSAWAKWKAGASCTVATADRIRAWIAANPPESAATNLEPADHRRVA